MGGGPYTGTPMANAPDLDRAAVLRQFDRRAAVFERADYLLREIEGRMFERLDLVRLAPASLLDVGCGLGAGLRSLAERYPQARAIGLDLAPAMLRRARPPPVPGVAGRLRALAGRMLGPAGATRSDRPRGPHGEPPGLVAGDAHRLPIAASSVDLIWSNLAFHWFDDPVAAIDEWHRVIRPGGLLMFSTFGVDTLQELRASGYPTMPLPDMHDIGDALAAAGFAEPVMDTERLTVTWSDPRTMHDELRVLGGDASRRRPRGLATPRRRATGLARLAQAAGAAGRPLSATFEVIYGHAWCPSPKRLPAGYAPVRFVRT
jgi:malonyl-CoA O-methyltransferase